jgi:predicted nucleic acid-binding protein
MNAFVVDASVALKWYLPDEQGVEQALFLLDAFMREEIALHAPSLIDWEFVNAMWVAGRTGRIALEDRDAAVQNFLGIEVSRTRCNDLSVSILSVATEFGRSCYDSAYLALSSTMGAPFVTGDKRLFNATKKKMPSVIWIEDLQVP